MIQSSCIYHNTLLIISFSFTDEWAWMISTVKWNIKKWKIPSNRIYDNNLSNVSSSNKKPHSQYDDEEKYVNMRWTLHNWCGKTMLTYIHNRSLADHQKKRKKVKSLSCKCEKYQVYILHVSTGFFYFWY